MKAEDEKQRTEFNHIWIFVDHRDNAIQEPTFGLIAEARRLLSDRGGNGTISAVALGDDLKDELERLAAYGIDRVVYVESEYLKGYHGELFAKVLARLIHKYELSCILMAQSPETADLSSRLAALMETAVVNRVMDLKIDETGKTMAIRPVANGYLFEKITLDGLSPSIVCFFPAVLSAPEPCNMGKIKIIREPMDEKPGDLKTKIVEVIEADPEDLDLEEADIIVSGGRGVGKGAYFNVIDELARALGGSVGGTRPVIDWQTLPYERQIGQTGKMVSPRLLINCGISGANEYTAGIEKSELVIAVNTDPRARIFKFADLGVIGDVHEILPLLIARIKEIKEQ